MNISFAGSGFIGIYHIGVISCLTDHAPYLLQGKLSGASFGSIAAALVIGGVAPDMMAACVVRDNYLTRQNILGPLNPSFDLTKMLHDDLYSVLPDNIHTLATGRLHVSVTEVWSRQSKIVNTFSSKEDLIQVILASSFVPGVSGWVPPVYNGMRVVDGCCSDNRPVLDEKTITVSPFSGNSHICPRDESQWFSTNNNGDEQTGNKEISPRKEIDLSLINVYRGYRAMRAKTPEELHRLCEEGYKDALLFLLENDLIICDLCQDLLEKLKLGNPTRNIYCPFCQGKRDQAEGSNLPESVNKVFEESKDSSEEATESSGNRTFTRNVLKVALLPAAFPLYISCLVLKKVLPTSVSTDF